MKKKAKQIARNAINIYQKGVTLVELVILIIITGVVVMPFANALTSVGKSLISNYEVLDANIIAQACAEHLWYQRRLPTTSFLTTDCNTIAGFSTKGTLSSVAYAPGAGICPTGTANPSSCEEITISVANDNAIERTNIKLFFIYP